MQIVKDNKFSAENNTFQQTLNKMKNAVLEEEGRQGKTALQKIMKLFPPPPEQIFWLRPWAVNIKCSLSL